MRDDLLRLGIALLWCRVDLHARCVSRQWEMVLLWYPA